MNIMSAALSRKSRPVLVKVLVLALLAGMLPVFSLLTPAGAAAATQLIVTTQPAGASSGSVFSTPVVVSAEDGSNAVDTNYSGSVTATLATGTGTLASATVNAVNGVATFSSLTLTGLVGSYSLSFASGALTSTTSSSFILSAGTPTQLVYVKAPAGAANGVTLTTQPVIDVEDAQGNVNLNASGTVNAVLTSGSGTLSNATASIVSGEATFSALTVSGTSGSITLTFYATGISGLSTLSTTLTMAGGTATQMVITQIPTNATSGLALTTATIPIVSFEDANGNVSSVTPTVTISIASGNGSLSMLSVKAVAGVAKFTGLVITANTPGPFTLLFQAPGFTQVTSSVIQVSGIATQLAITTQPSGSTSGAVLTQQPVVAIEDAQGNVVTTDSTTTVAVSFATGTGTLAANSVKAVNGIVTFTALKITATSGSYTLNFTASGLTTATSSSLTVSGPAAALSFMTPPAGAANGSAFSTQPELKIVDSSGNLVTSSAVGSVTAVLQSGTGTLIGTTSATVTNGVATFTNLGVSGASASVTVSFLAPGLSSVTSSALSVSASATKLVLTTAPAGVVSGVAFTTQPVVSVEDASSVLVSGYVGTVTASLASGSGSLTNTTASVSGGHATFTNLTYTGSGAFVITFTSSPLTGASSATLSAAGVATQLVLTTQPYGVTSGVAFTTQPVLRVEDASGNLVASASGTVTASITSGSGVLSNYSASVVNGVATFTNLTYTGSSTFVITFTSSGLTSAVSGALSEVGTGTRLVIASEPNGSIAGEPLIFQPVVRVVDAYGNVVTSYNAPVTASIDYGTGTLTNYTTSAVNGVATFTALSVTSSSGSIALVFQGVGVAAAVSSAFTVNVGPASQLVIAPPFIVTSSSGVPAKTAPVVKIEDAAGNAVASYTGTVTATLTSGTGVLSGTSATLVNGVATFNSLSVAGGLGSYQIRFSVAGFVTVSTLTFELAGTPTKLVFAVAPTASVACGASFAATPVVQVVDSSGYVVSNATGTVTATLSPANGRVVNATVSVVNGVATFAGLALDAKVGTYTLSFKSSIATTPVSASVQVLVGTPVKLVVATPPSPNTVSGQSLIVQPVLQLVDAYGNVVPTTGVAQVALTNATPASGSGPTTTLVHNQATLTKGVVRFSGLSLKGATGPVKVTFSAGGFSTTTTLFVRTAAFFAPLHVGFAPSTGYVSAAGRQQILNFATRMASRPRIMVIGYAPYNVALALFRARQAAAVLQSRLKTTVLIRYDTLTRLNEVVLQSW